MIWLWLNDAFIMVAIVSIIHRLDLIMDKLEIQRRKISNRELVAPAGDAVDPYLQTK